MNPRREPIALRVHNQTRHTVLCERATVAHGLRGRGVGLLGRNQLGAGEGMLFEAAALVPLMWMHTFFMAFPIDIVFLDSRNTVLRIDRSLKPWRFSSMVVGAHKAIEIAADASARAQTAVGDTISLEKI